MDDSDEEQEEDEDMLLACVLVREYLEEKKKGQNFMLETEHFTIYKCMDAILDSELLSYKFPETEKELNEAAFSTAAKDLTSKLTAIEEDLYQTKNRSGQDPLNFPIKLGNRLSALRRSLETGDAKPTAGVYKVFNELSVELNGHLSKLDNLLKINLAPLNQILISKQLKPIVHEK